MTAGTHGGARSGPPLDQTPLGDLVASATADLSALLRAEVALAKVELKKDAAAAGKGVGMFGGAAFAGLLALIFLSIAAAYALGRLVPLGAGFLIVGALYLLAAAVLGLVGLKSVKRISPPARTIATVKDDVAWAKHPTVAPTRRVV